MDKKSALLLLLLLFSLALQQQLGISDASSSPTVRCHALERDALVDFKQKLRDPSGRLSSWVGQDCCVWEGVRCSNITGHVVQLNLRNRKRLESFVDCSVETSYYWIFDEYGCKWALLGSISWSLLSLQYLWHLDLSGNFFQHNPIPEFLGSFSRLTYLNLSGAGFKGKVPDQLGNLSNLHHLDLSFNVVDDDYIDSGYLYTENAGWISHLTSLQHLNMDYVNFRNASNWLQAMNALPHIQEIRLSFCEIVSFPPHNSMLHVNFTSLTTLDLSYNYINTSIPNWLFNLTSLEHLDLGGNYLNWVDLALISKLTSLNVLDLSYNVLQPGFVPTAFRNLCRLQALFLRYVDINDEIINLQVVFSGCLMLSLEELDLSDTGLWGYLPDWLWSMNNLKLLFLRENSLYGPLPASLGSLSSLQYLDIGNNNLNGTIPEGIFGRMQGLVTLDIGGNSLILSEMHLANLASTLKDLDISSNTLFLNESYEDWIPPFQLETLFMSSCRILPSPQFPKWLSTQTDLYWLWLSSMGIKDTFPNWLPSTLEFLDLSNNEITGHIPQQHLLKLKDLDLSNNSLSGQLPLYINNTMPIMRTLDLSKNNLTGGIPSSICRIKHLFKIGLSSNNFSGKPPNCWKKSAKVIVLDLSRNNLQGEIPNSLCNMEGLQLLHLSHNNLSGQIPTCLKGCINLTVLDLGHNHLSGNIPTWIEENLLDLRVLNLRSNALTGNISPSLSNLEQLRVLDFSNNNLSGAIPLSFGDFSALKGYPINDDDDVPYYTLYDDGVWLFIKGNELKYIYMSSYVRMLDLSSNGLYGYIPHELGNLNLLQSLNLSYNYLTGEIPRSIDGMQQLEVLDLSRNNLLGVIPSSLASLNFLGILDLSYNNLSGRIPTGSQLQTFNQFSYIGNPNLCGSPLSKNCTSDKTNGVEEIQKKDIDPKTEITWLYASIALGFITGFWMICGALIYKSRWRFAFFRAIDSMHDKIYVKIVVNVAKLRRK